MRTDWRKVNDRSIRGSDKIAAILTKCSDLPIGKLEWRYRIKQSGDCKVDLQGIRPTSGVAITEEVLAIYYRATRHKWQGNEVRCHDLYAIVCNLV
jgi:hypothetical protein